MRPSTATGRPPWWTNRRLLPGEAVETELEDIRARLARIADADPAFEFDAEPFEHSFSPAEIPADSRFAARLLGTVERVTGRRTEVFGTPYVGRGLRPRPAASAPQRRPTQTPGHRRTRLDSGSAPSGTDIGEDSRSSWTRARSARPGVLSLVAHSKRRETTPEAPLVARRTARGCVGGRSGHPDRDPIWWRLVANRDRLVNGKLALPPGPGFGWVLDTEVIEHYRVDL